MRAKERDAQLNAWADRLRESGYDVTFRVGDVVVVCRVCGAQVRDTDRHTAWHDGG